MSTSARSSMDFGALRAIVTLCTKCSCATTDVIVSAYREA